MIIKTPDACSGLLCPIREIGNGVEVLLTQREFWHKRKKHPRAFPGEWMFTGGTFEDGDTNLLYTAMREFREELEYRDRFSNPKLFHSVDRSSYGKLYHLEHYVAQIDESLGLTLSEIGRVELRDVRWFSPSDALRLICSEEFTQQQLWQYKKLGLDNPKYGVYAVSFRQFPRDVVDGLRKIEREGMDLLAG